MPIERQHSSNRTRSRVMKERKHRRDTTPYMTEVWYPQATKDELANAGSFFVTLPWRGVLHTTEGSSYAGARQAYINNRSAPHFTVSFEGGVFRARQHVPINKAARALRNVAGGVETNRLRTIQIEVVAFAASSGSLATPYLDGLARLMRWIENNTEIKPVGPPQGLASAYGQTNKRFTNDAWNNFNGWCGHANVPENSHWDPGMINLQYLLTFETGGCKPMFDPPLAIRLVDAIPDVDTGQGALLLQDDGAVFGMAGARYWGGVNGKPYWGSRKAARIRKPADIPGLPANMLGYKYVITSTEGQHYGMPD